MANHSINNLEELLAEKARLRAQLEIVQEEMRVSAGRTRDELSAFIENKFSIPKQLGKLFQGGGSQEAAGSSAIGAVGRVVGLNPLWSGVLATLGPVLVRYAQNQLRKRKERKAAKIEAAAEGALEAPDEEATSGPPMEVKKRGLFRKKRAEE